SFPGVRANDGVDLEVAAGEVHVLLGENGAGKTTLTSILAGLYQPDAGAIQVDGRAVALASPRDAYRHGIGMVHQHFRLVPSFTVAENVLLGLDAAGRRPEWRLRARDHRAHIAEVARQFDLPVDVDAPVWQLSVGQQQRVEIVKMLYRGVRVLILDEPTAALTPRGGGALSAAPGPGAGGGGAVIFTPPSRDGGWGGAARIPVMRRGGGAPPLPPAETAPRRLAALMVGDALEAREPARPGPAAGA